MLALKKQVHTVYSSYNNVIDEAETCRSSLTNRQRIRIILTGLSRRTDTQ